MMPPTTPFLMRKIIVIRRAALPDSGRPTTKANKRSVKGVKTPMKRRKKRKRMRKNRSSKKRKLKLMPICLLTREPRRQTKM